MKDLAAIRGSLTIGAALALLCACGSLQVPMNAPPTGAQAMPQTSMRATPSTNSNYKVLYMFRKAPDGVRPEANLIDDGGMLYGTTEYGGIHNRGTVFTITVDGTEKVLHSFGGPDGARPTSGLVDVNRKFYGTTQSGGTASAGTVFSVTKGGKEKVLHSFGAADGSDPKAGLAEVAGMLYGTTAYGGTRGRRARGTVFEIDTSGSEKLLHTFTVVHGDGARPAATLIDVGGVLYGTTAYGGAPHGGGGTVFSITTAGKESVLHSFTLYGSDGSRPLTSLTALNGTLYGTTSGGGAYTCYLQPCGTVFSVTTAGSEQVLYNFSGAPDGAFPVAGLVDVNGTLYGTTSTGGSHGGGTLFSITPSGTETILHNFGSGERDGILPAASLIAVNGTLYGTTAGGGEPCSCGTVFEFKLPSASRFVSAGAANGS
ncbi:MAG: choice-of-anchor tandem repeat GloVer-containing protein [Candidatus Cybelea sp.]